MILVILINFIYQVSLNFILLFTSPIHDQLVNLSTRITALQIPVTLYELFAVACYFLPMGTITTLLLITISLISLQIVNAIFRFIIHLGVLN